MKFRKLFTALLVCVATCGWAQQPTPKSILINQDGTVTFRYKNDHAKNVQVDVQFAGRNPMQRGADGVWTATLGPVAPDMYPYCFIVDGIYRCSAFII